MNDEQADELLRNNDWAKWSDARELLQTAAHMGAIEERQRVAEACNAYAVKLRATAPDTMPTPVEVANYLRDFVLGLRA